MDRIKELEDGVNRIRKIAGSFNKKPVEKLIDIEEICFGLLGLEYKIGRITSASELNNTADIISDRIKGLSRTLTSR